MAAITMLALLPGCDDSPAPPPEVQQEEDHPKVDEPPPPPSTQELTQGPYKTLALPGLPLSLEVPESWKIETLGTSSINLVMGFAPHGPIQINLSHRPRTTQEKLDIMIEGARKEMAADPEHIRKFDVYPRGNMKIVERQVISHEELPVDPANPSAPSGPMMRWTITTYIPSPSSSASSALGSPGASIDETAQPTQKQQQELNSYELNFIGLPEQQFEADQAFLRKIIDSLSYDAASSSASNPPPQ